MLKQMREVLDLVKRLYPYAKPGFIFDRSRCHMGRAADALSAYRMNKNPGGEQPVMRDGYWPDENKPQSMTFQIGDTVRFDFKLKTANSDDNDEQKRIPIQEGRKVTAEDVHLIGIPKGAKQVAMERGLGPRGKKRDWSKAGKQGEGMPKAKKRRWKTRQWQEALAHLPDFENQKCAVQEMIEAEGGVFVLLPPAHPELNPQERLWALQKQTIAAHHVKNHSELLKALPQAIWQHGRGPEAVQVIRKCFGHSARFEEAYKAGLHSGIAFKVVARTTHRGHTDVDLGDLLDQLPAETRRDLVPKLRVCCFCDVCLAQRGEAPA